MATPLILASSSPRRRELLANAGIPYLVDAPDVEESCALPAREAVAELSRRLGASSRMLCPGSGHTGLLRGNRSGKAP